MKLHEQKTTLLDNCFNMLTSQLQKKFDLPDKKLAVMERQNITIPDAANLEQKYKQFNRAKILES